MGHSDGTFFGIQVAARAPVKVPRLYRRGADDQPAEVRATRVRVHAEALSRARRYRDGAKARSRAGPLWTVVSRAGYVAIRDEAMHRLGIGTMHTMTNYLQGLFLGSLQAREYTLGKSSDCGAANSRLG